MTTTEGTTMTTKHGTPTWKFKHLWDVQCFSCGAIYVDHRRRVGRCLKCNSAAVIVVPTEIEIGDVVEEFYSDDAEKSPYSAYVSVDVAIDGTRYLVGCVVGARDSDHGTVRAAGGDVRPFCAAWWADASDWESLPGGTRDEVLAALTEESYRLFCQVRKD